MSCTFYKTCHNDHHWTTFTNLLACSNVVVDESEDTLHCTHVLSHYLLEMWNKTQHRKCLKSVRYTINEVADVGHKLLQSWISVVKSTTKKHARNDVRNTHKGQLSHVKRTTLLLSHFLYHFFHFHQDPCLHHAMTKSKPFHDRQTQLMMAPETWVVTMECYSYTTKQQQRFCRSSVLYRSE